MQYDVAILGGGIIGTAVLNKLTRIGVKSILVEKNSDVASETTKANSGIVHAGFDAKPGTKKAVLNVRGAKIMPTLCKELGVDLINNGALVIGNDMHVVKDLYDRGVKNGVSGLEILNRNDLLKLLPDITDNITCGLFAKTSSIVSPYELAIALAEEAVINGAEVVFDYDTTSVTRIDDKFVITNGTREIVANKIVIACGGEHNEIAKIIGSKQYDIKYRRGEYYLLDRNSMNLTYTVFPLPSKDSKGVLVSPTTHGNIIVGPTSILTESNNTITTLQGLEDISAKANLMLNDVNLRKNIRVFSGVRTLVGEDFVIEKDENIDGVINVTGICSPGLTASPAIAEEVVKLLGYDISKEKKMKPRQKSIKIADLSQEELNKLIKKDENYGKIVCRCENVSLKEIIDAINSPLKPKSLDAIKRRTRAGMGRCQGGFCFMKVMETLAKEHGITLDDVTKENKNSQIIMGKIK